VTGMWASLTRWTWRHPNGGRRLAAVLHLTAVLIPILIDPERRVVPRSATPTLRRPWPVLTSDKPSDNGLIQWQTERDALRNRNLSDLRQSDPPRWCQTKPAGMAERSPAVVSCLIRCESGVVYLNH
jgi:hypothetical protein